MTNVSVTDVNAEVLSNEERYLALSFCLFLLWFGLYSVSILRKRKIVMFPESGLLIVIGAVSQLCLRIISKNNFMVRVIDQMINFNDIFFFVVLLPPIVFEAGYNLPIATFFSNFGFICTLAFLGTFISMMLTALICWSWSNSDLSVYPFNFLESMIFGSIVSATDPVAVLVAFSSVGMDPVIFIAVLGEAVLNDAVALVFYQTLIEFEVIKPDIVSFFLAFLRFIWIFLGSLVIGCSLGTLVSLFYKYGNLRLQNDTIKLEMALVLVIPYLSYFISQGCGFSGIVSLMFFGIMLSRYSANNFSRETNALVNNVFPAFAQLSETFIFLYMGISFGNFDDSDLQHLNFAGVSILAVNVARIAHVLIVIALCNLFRPRNRAINWKGTLVLCVAGLRGPMAFALSAWAAKILGRQGSVMNTATIMMVFVTTFLTGFITPPLIRHLKLEKPGSGSVGGWCSSLKVEDVFVIDEVHEETCMGRFEDTYVKPCLTRSDDQFSDLSTAQAIPAETELQYLPNSSV